MKTMVLLAFAISQFACAQTTWHGLRFGMNEADIQKNYQGTLQRGVGDDGLVKLSDANQKLGSWPATAVLHLDKGGKLFMIEVNIVDPFTAEPSTGAIGSSFALISVLGEQLTQKYGVPTTSDGECGLTIPDVVEDSGRMFGCNKMWRTSDQTVGMSWFFEGGRLTLFSIVYKPLPSDI